MVAREKEPRRKRALLGLVLIVVALLLLLALLEGPDGQMGCAPLSPVSADPSPPPVMEPAVEELDAPPRTVQPVRAPEMTLHGRVVDARTNEPIPWVDLEITWDKGSVQLRTPKDGKFSTTLEIPNGKIKARVSDAGEEVGVVEWTLGKILRRDGWTIGVKIGPTIPIRTLDGKPPGPDDQWRARLFESPFPFGSAGEISVRGGELWVPAELDERDWEWRPVRYEGDEAFVRWPRVKFPSERNWYPGVVLRSEPRFLKARDAVKSTMGIQRPVDVQTTPFAILTGRVVVQGEVGGSARVHVADGAAETGIAGKDVPFFAQVMSRESTYTVETPVLQTFRVSAWFPGHVATEARVRVEKGQQKGPELTLFSTFSIPADHELDLSRDLQRTSSGKQLLRARLERTPLSEAWLFEIPPSGRIDTGKLPTGEFAVESIALDEEPVLVSRISGQPLPARALDRSRMNARQARPHRIELAAAATAQQFSVTSGPAGSLLTTAPVPPQRTWSLADSNAAEFLVWVPGCSPTRVRESDFRPDQDGVVATVLPSRGWGTLLVFVADDPLTVGLPKLEKVRMPREKTRTSREGTENLVEMLARSPLPGVHVEYKGVPLGTSDGEGCALVGYTTQPDKLSLFAPGWRMNGLERMPGGGSRWWVSMKRDP